MGLLKGGERKKKQRMRGRRKREKKDDLLTPLRKITYLVTVREILELSFITH